MLKKCFAYLCLLKGGFCLMIQCLPCGKLSDAACRVGFGRNCFLHCDSLFVCTQDIIMLLVCSKSLNMFNRVSAIFTSLCGVLLFVFLHIKSLLLKRVYCKRKELVPLMSKSFPFRADPFSKGMQNNFNRDVALERAFILLKENGKGFS